MTTLKAWIVRHPIIFIAIVVFCLVVVVSVIPTTDQRNVQEPSTVQAEPTQADNAREKKEEDIGIGTASHVKWMDEQMSQYSGCIKKFAGSPGFERLTPKLLPLLASAEQIFGASHPLYAKAVRDGDKVAAFGEGTLDIYAMTSLSTECAVLGDPQSMSESSWSEAMRRWYVKTQGRLVKAESKVATYEYESAARGESEGGVATPREALEEARKLEQQSEQESANGDYIAAHILILHSSLWLDYMSERLADWEQKQSVRRTAARGEVPK